MFRKIKDKSVCIENLPKRYINGKEVIAWKNSEGVQVDFIYDGQPHSLVVVKYIDRKHIKVLIDKTIEKTIQPKAVLSLSFAYEFMKKVFRYNIGDIIGDIEIVDRIEKPYNQNSKYTRAAYRCRCLKDNYIFERLEYEIDKNILCPVCSHNVVLKGFNDIATTAPWMVKYFKNFDEPFKYAKCSNARVSMVCPYCGTLKNSIISDVYRRGFSCNKCSDGISYPNKFAHELFYQLSCQYQKYNIEYSPSWAKPYKYDNYIKLLNGHEIIVEMDGGLHFKNGFANSDQIKDELAQNHNITMIRVDCNYSDLEYRFDYIKNNIIAKLKPYFDLSKIDWNACGLCAINSKVHLAIDDYNNSSSFDILECAKKLKLSKSTVNNYLKLGNSLGLCKYEIGINNDGEHERLGQYKPIAMYDKNLNLISVYPSVVALCEQYNYNVKTVRETCCGRKRSYGGYYFKYISREEYYKNKTINALTI